jgi:tetratricopeptide (TPR) repeat protein
VETQTEAFEARIDLLAGELELALKWDRPSILLAIYASEFVRMEAQQALAERLRAWDVTVTPYTVSGKEDADIPRALAQHPDREESVFFVSGLRWGGGKDGRNAYRALNLRREYFVEYRIRAVFWLTESEAARLPHAAPDFWAFRHRAVEFVEAPRPEQIAPVARDLAWADWSDRTLAQDIEAKIALREGLLRDLPESDETLAARADLIYTLGTLYNAKQEYEKALEHFKQALTIFKRLEDTERQSWSWNGLGNVYIDLGRHDDAEAAYRHALDRDPDFAAYAYNGLGTVYDDLGRYEEAEAAYRNAIDRDPDYATPWNGLGNVYADLGRYDDAEAAYRQAIDLDPDDAYAYHGLGNVYRAQGRYDDAETAYRKVIALDPEIAIAHSSLASVLRKLGREEETNEHISRARALMANESDYNQACIEAIAGNVEAALAHLERALTQAPGNRDWAARDPDLEPLHGHPRFEALVGGDEPGDTAS